MIEILVMIAAIVALGKIADFENRSMLVWGGLGLILVVGASVLVAIPYLGVGVGFAATFVGMMIAKAVQGT